MQNVGTFLTLERSNVLTFQRANAKIAIATQTPQQAALQVHRQVGEQGKARTTS
jgi:hypothetical protein